MNIARAMRPFTGCSPWTVLAAPEYLPLARELVEALGPKDAELGTLIWEHFPDRTPKLTLDPEVVRGRDVVLLAPLDMGDVMSYFSAVYAIPRYFARSFLVVTPYFLTGTMERVEHEGEIATAMTLARMMSATPSPTVGSTVFMFFDIHALATRFYFSDAVQPILASAIPTLIDYVDAEMSPAKNPSGKALVVAYPDAGARKRFSALVGEERFDVCVCNKVRVGDKRIVSLTEGEPAGRDVIIIDDLVQSGGTLLECVKLLYEQGANTVSCYVTHGVFPNDTWKRFEPEAMAAAGVKPLRRFIMTNSIPKTAAKVAGREPFAVLSLAPRLAELLRTRE